MQYLSPSTFFGETLSAPIDKKAIQLGRKKLFAELELSGGSTIELNGRQLTKNDIIQYFESLLKEDSLDYHNAVGEDPVLLRFLEDAMIGRKEMLQNNPLYNDDRFISWVSPYFHHSFLAFMTTCFLVEPDEDGLVALLVNNRLMTPDDFEKAWEAVIKILMDDISALEQYHMQTKSGGDTGHTQIAYLMEFSYIRLIQLLPQSRFASIRDKYAQCMLNVCIVAFNMQKQPGDIVRTWLENAGLLAVSESVKAGINDKLSELDALDLPAEEKKSDSAPWKIILFAVIIVIRMATCKTNSTPTYYHSTPTVLPPPSNWTREQVIDSLKSKYPHLDWKKIEGRTRDSIAIGNIK